MYCSQTMRARYIKAVSSSSGVRSNAYVPSGRGEVSCLPWGSSCEGLSRMAQMSDKLQTPQNWIPRQNIGAPANTINCQPMVRENVVSDDAQIRKSLVRVASDASQVSWMAHVNFSWRQILAIAALQMGSSHPSQSFAYRLGMDLHSFLPSL